VVVFTFLMFPASFWPHTIPYTVTVWGAAALPQSFEFLFWSGGLVVFPVVPIYTGAVFWIFSGKLGRSYMGWGLMAALNITSPALRAWSPLAHCGRGRQTP